MIRQNYHIFTLVDRLVKDEKRREERKEQESSRSVKLNYVSQRVFHCIPRDLIFLIGGAIIEG